MNKNFESIHKLQVVKRNRLTLSSVFFFFLSGTDLWITLVIGNTQTPGDVKANVTKKSALFGPLFMQNGFKV